MHKILLGDCFDRLRNINDNSVDLILLDPPYKKTALKWDKKFSHDIVDELRRIVVDTGVIIIFGREPELSYYRIKGIDMYKYDFIWKKNRKNGYVLANNRPLQETEKIAIFSKGNTFTNSKVRMKYIPQFTVPCHTKAIRGKTKPKYFVSGCVGGSTGTRRDFPTDIIECDQEWKCSHPTEKPLQLYEYLILTYTQLGDTVLDPCMGSGNSIIAAKTLNRNFIGIEKDEEYFNNIESKL